MQVNVIMAYRNTKKELVEKAIESLANQTYKDFTLIAVDDNSTPESHEILTDAVFKYPDMHANVIWLLNRDKNFAFGPGPTREKGMNAADADCKYMCFLDSDDFLTPTSLEERVVALEKSFNNIEERAVAVYGNKYTLDLRNNANVKTLEIVPEFDRERFGRECYIPSNSVMFRYQIWKKRIGYMLNTKLAEDYNLWLKLATFGDFIKIEVPIYTQTIHGANLTLNKEVLATHAACLSECYIDFLAWVRKMQEQTK